VTPPQLGKIYAGIAGMQNAPSLLQSPRSRSVRGSCEGCRLS
jgi:hypothetical protein